MDTATLASKIASTIEGALRVQGPGLLQHPEASVVVSAIDGAVSLRHGLVDGPNEVSALINRQPSAARLYECLRLQSEIGTERITDGYTVASIDFALVQPAIDRLALDLTGVLDDKLRSWGRHHAPALSKLPKPRALRPPPTLPEKIWKWVVHAGAIFMMLVVMAVFGAAFKTAPSMRAAKTTAAPAIVDPFRTATAPPTPPVDQESRWQADVELFIQTRCELASTNPLHRATVTAHLAMFQQAINEVATPTMSNRDVLEAAGERVYTYPQYTPRGFCPYP